MNNINIAIIICTYKKEKYVLKNVSVLKKCQDTIKHVFIIDNGQTLTETINSSFITVVKNKNLGGSGGFARGIFEAKKRNEFTHIMLMDDDVEITESILNKASNKLKKLSQDDWLGFCMSTFERPDLIFESCSNWNGIKVHYNSHNIKINENSDLKIKKYNHAGWWGLIIPMDFINKHGYPLPFFIKFDDIEYGLRRKGENIIFDKNIYVKHESFKNKYNPFLEYYNIRNSFITNAIHFKHAKLVSLIRYIEKFIKFYFTGKFKAIKLSNLGCKEYFIGPSLFINQNLENINNRINQISNEPLNVLKAILIYPIVMLFYCFKIIFNFNKTKICFLNNYEYLTSIKYWMKQFNIN